MFELFSGEHRRTPHRDTVPILITSTVHLIVLGAILVIPLLYISSDYPRGTGHARVRGNRSGTAATTTPAPAGAGRNEVNSRQGGAEQRSRRGAGSSAH